jgi:3-hydroxy-9,10-secoandrosta-1,3,5(10)-triene-9,17-dione monooxygenase reductase component
MSETAIDPRKFRDALGAFTTGVTVVTTRDAEGVDVGITANSFNSVSLEPPMVLWSLAKASRSLPAFVAAQHFAVHILAADQDALSAQFAQRGMDKFANLTVERGRSGTPLLSGCAARFQCRTAFQYEGGDHVIFVGKVEEFDHSGHPPLVYHGGRYALAVKREHPANMADLASEPDSSFSQDFLIYLLGRAHHHLFIGLRRELERFGLSEDGWFVLSLLGVSEHRTLAELNRLLSYTGKEINYELVANLAANGFVLLHGAYDPQVRVSLTESGRQTVIELVAAGKASEDHATRNLETGEQLLLKQALRRLIRDTDLTPGSLRNFSTEDGE